MIEAEKLEFAEDNQFELPRTTQGKIVEAVMKELAQVFTKAIEAPQAIFGIEETILQVIDSMLILLQGNSNNKIPTPKLPVTPEPRVNKKISLRSPRTEGG